MSRDMKITVICDAENCLNTIEIDLDEGEWNEIPDVKIESILKHKGWYTNLDGDYCTNCADNAKKKWNSQ